MMALRAKSTPPGPGREAEAFAPGHVSGLFAPAARGRDPRARGSVGAGIVLELGVRARAVAGPASRPALRLTGDVPGPFGISEDVARRLLGRRAVRLEVTLAHDLPIGQGFGASAAGALATALATAAVLRRPPDDARETAHLAELFGGGGLGGVASILGGGWERRIRPGVPPWGRVVHRPFRYPILLSVVGGPIPSPRVLADAARLQRMRDAGEEGLRRLRERPTAERFLDESERFTDAAGLAGPAVRRLLGRLRRAGAWAGQAMFGRAVWTVPRGPRSRVAAVEALRRARVPAVEIGAARRGAGIVSAAGRGRKAF